MNACESYIYVTYRPCDSEEWGDMIEIDKIMTGIYDQMQYLPEKVEYYWWRLKSGLRASGTDPLLRQICFLLKNGSA